MSITVIIPHLNQPEHLKRGLSALAEQQNVRRQIDVIVVDNGSKDMPNEICNQWPNTTLLRQETPGPGPARNLGISRAKGDILAFIDADCHAHPNWLAAIETAFENNETLVIGGDVQVPFIDADKPTQLESYERVFGFRNREYVASGYSGTGNLAMRPEAFDHVGPFGGIEMAEDRDWGLRATRLGIRTRYVADMIVYHPARLHFREMQQKWDRHIAHDFSRVQSASAKMKWLARALAIGLSPLGELPKVFRSNRISGLTQRSLALRCLIRIRAYRCLKMLAVLWRGDGRALSQAWNRDS